MQVQEKDLLTLDNQGQTGGGFSLQINAYNHNPEPITPTSNCPTTWMQFILSSDSGQLSASVQYSLYGQTFDPFQWRNLEDMSGNQISNANPLLVGQVLKIVLDYDASNNITGADFYVTEPDGKTPLGHAYVPAPENCLYQMQAFQVDIVSAPALGFQPSFSSGKGTITYSTNGRQLCNEGASLGNRPLYDTCTGTYAVTYENINVSYGALSSCCGSELTQPFDVPKGK
jgi:hypothetical protein